MMQRILVGYDGSDPSRRALDQAVCLARHFQCPLTVLTAAVDRLVRADGVVTMAADEAHGREVAEQGAAVARAQGLSNVDTVTTVDGPDEALVAEAARGYDLIVLGHRSLGVLEELFVGSTAKHVVDRANCSVMVVR